MTRWGHRSCVTDPLAIAARAWGTLGDGLIPCPRPTTQGLAKAVLQTLLLLNATISTNELKAVCDSLTVEACRLLCTGSCLLSQQQTRGLRRRYRVQAFQDTQNA